MAVKKIRLDFSKVEERSGWNTKQMPEGLHKMKVESVQESEASDGTPMLVYALVPADGRYKTRRFPFYCKLQPNQLWKLRDLIVSAGGTVPKKLGNVDPNSPVGKFIAAEVEDETGQYAGRSSVNGTYGLDILDEDGASGEPDEDDEEFEDSEEAEDEDFEADDEDEEEDEDDEDEDLTTLTLAELRKLAKSFGIDTAGLKKDDLIESIEEAQSEGEEDDEDEDDLDDEDLEDEDADEDFEDDEEDEEEEPEPAPKRRPVAKKAAPAAPAKRVVRRR